MPRVAGDLPAYHTLSQTPHRSFSFWQRCQAGLWTLYTVVFLLAAGTSNTILAATSTHGRTPTGRIAIPSHPLFRSAPLLPPPSTLFLHASSSPSSFFLLPAPQPGSQPLLTTTGIVFAVILLVSGIATKRVYRLLDLRASHMANGAEKPRSVRTSGPSVLISGTASEPDGGGVRTTFPYLSEEEVEELEILPVAENQSNDEAFLVEYHQERAVPPVQRSITSRHACQALADLPEAPETLRWVNITGNQDSLTVPVLSAFRIHPLFMEDILHDAERSKVENLGVDELIVLFQAVQLVEESSPNEVLPMLRLEMNQISLVLQSRVLLSFFNAPSKTVEQCKACIALAGSKLRTSSPHWLVHMIMDKEVDRLYPIMNRFRQQLEQAQELLESKRPRGIVANPNSSNAHVLHVVQITGQEMNNLLFVLRPLASTVAALTEYAKQRGMTELQWHFEDLRDHIATILDYVSSMQTWVKCLKDDYSYIQQENMNRTMYTLTLITAFFVPAQFLTGLFGMNFQYMPWLNWEYGFLAFWGVIVGISGGIILTFKRFQWL